MINSILINFYSRVSKTRIPGREEFEYIKYLFETDKGYYEVESSYGFQKVSNFDFDKYILEKNNKRGLGITDVGSNNDILVIKFSDGSFMEYKIAELNPDTGNEYCFFYSPPDSYQHLEAFLKDKATQHLSDEHPLYELK